MATSPSAPATPTPSASIAISQNRGITKEKTGYRSPGAITMVENAANFEAQNEKAKSAVVAQVVRIVRRTGLDYEGWRYVAKRVRQACDLRPERKGRRLPRVLTSDDFRRFYQAVDQAHDVQH